MSAYSPLIFRSLVFLFLLLTLPVFSSQAASLLPRFSGDISVTSYILGKADLLFPITSDDDHNFYINPAIGLGTDHQGYADLGVGYRWIQNKASIIGLYLFSGYSRSNHDANLWIANPGFELLGRRWDAHLNGYLVGGQRNHTFGEARQPILLMSQHSAYYGLIDQRAVQHSGHGGDIEFGYQLFSHIPLQGYAGSFLFFPSKSDSIWGGVVGLEYWASPSINIFIRYSYDPIQRNVGAMGVGFEFGGTHLHRVNPCLEERITDPVKRYIAELGQGSKIPNRHSYELTTQLALLSRSFAFFSQTGTPNNGGASLTIENCTFEHPCGPRDFSQIGINRLDTLLPGTLMFFSGGEYTATGGGKDNELILNHGQQIYGRLGSNYLGIPSGNQRTVFNGAFELTGNNFIDSIIILPGISYPQGVLVSDGSINSLINNTQIGAGEFGAPSGESETAITLNRDSSLVVQNSQLITSGPDASTTIVTNRNSEFRLNNSQVTLIGGDTASGITVGESFQSRSFALIRDSAVWVNIPSVGDQGYGISVASGSEIIFEGGSIEITATNGFFSAGLGIHTISNTTQCINNNNIEPCV